MESHPQLTIRAVRARGLDLTLARPVETASGVMRSTPLVLIDLATDEGITGVSYVRCYTPTALGPLVQLIANLERVLKGAPAAPASVERTLQRHFRLLGTQGLTGIAMAGSTWRCGTRAPKRAAFRWWCCSAASRGRSPPTRACVP
jgi:mandelate racemase